MVGRAWSVRDRWRSDGERSAIAATGLMLGTIALASLGAQQATQAWGAQRAVAHATRTLKVHDEGHLHFVSSSGSQLIDEGAASGTLPGRVRLQFTYDGSPTVSAQFTIRGGSWSIRVRARARLSNPTSPNPSFRGTLTITGGSGRYAHARGTGEMFGVFNRRNYGLTVQAFGKLTY
jgi:hypothetical protein